jgi:hypothetical protein
MITEEVFMDIVALHRQGHSIRFIVKKLGMHRSQEMDPYAHNPASISVRALLRQTPKIGARCGNAARRDLCGGPPERVVPTANDVFIVSTCAI